MRITIKSPIEIEITETKSGGMFDTFAPQIVAALLPTLLRVFVRDPEPTAPRCQARNPAGEQCVRCEGHDGPHTEVPATDEPGPPAVVTPPT